MNIHALLRRIMADFFIISTGILFCYILCYLVFAPDTAFYLIDLIHIPVAAAISSLPHLIFYSRKEMSKKQWRRRSIIHLVTLEIVVLSMAKPFHWLNNANVREYAILFLLVLAVYAVVLFFGWRRDAIAADHINHALKSIKKPPL